MGWGEGTEYFWVVLCKNRGVHNKYNLFSSHAIRLAETDEVSPVPQVGAFKVRCDDCGEEHSYDDKEVLRAELEPLDPFIPHPLFSDSTLKAAATGSATAPGLVSTVTKTLLERVHAVVGPYLRFRHKDSPPPRWRR